MLSRRIEKVKQVTLELGDNGQDWICQVSKRASRAEGTAQTLRDSGRAGSNAGRPVEG